MSYLELTPSGEWCDRVAASSGVVPAIYGRVGPGVCMDGLGASETPDVKDLPWDLDKKPSKSEARWSMLEKVGAVAGVIGAVTGAYFGIRQLLGRR